MKKVLLIVGIIVGLLFIALVAILSFDFNRLGKENVYVKITQDGRVEEDRLNSGEVMKRYWYNLNAYDKDGKQSEVEFSAAKNLRLDAYLMLYINKDGVVTSYDEVKLEDVPEKASEQLN